MNTRDKGKPTFEECMAEAMAELVRGWLDEHPEALAEESPPSDVLTDGQPPSALT